MFRRVRDRTRNLETRKKCDLDLKYTGLAVVHYISSPNPSMYSRVIDLTQNLETMNSGPPDALKPKCEFDLADTGLAVEHCTSSCYSDHLCQVISKSLNVHQTY